MFVKYTRNSWFILGAGSMGCLWASSLIESGEHCTLLVKSDSLKKYQDKKIIVERGEKQTEFTVETIATNQIKPMIKKLLITLKAPTAIIAIESILHCLNEKSKVFILMNGLGIQQKLIEILPTKNIWLASSSDGVYKKSPLHINHAGRGVTWVGNLFNKKQPLPFQTSSLPWLQIKPCEDIFQKLWVKVGINSVINPLSVRYQCKNGMLWSNLTIRQRVISLAFESECVIRKKISLPNSLIRLTESVIQATSNNRSSTLQDVMSGCDTELPWFNGYLIQIGEKLNCCLDEHYKLANELNELYGINVIDNE